MKLFFISPPLLSLYRSPIHPLYFSLRVSLRVLVPPQEFA
jgi:hypothetical protein